MIKFVTTRDACEFSFNDNIQLAGLNELLEWRRGRAYICLDTETNTLDYRAGALLLKQFGDWDTQFVVDCSTINIPDSFYKSVLFVAHNVEFDYNQLKRDRIILERVYDTMIAEKLLTQGKYTDDYIKTWHPYTLAALVHTVVGYDMNKAIRTTYKDFNFTQEQIEYAADDVKYLDVVYKNTWERVVKDDLVDCLALENRYVLALADMMYHGIRLDKEEWLEREKETIIEKDGMAYKIDDYLIEDYPKIIHKHGTSYQHDLFNPDKRSRKLALNYNSHLQVKKVFDLLGINVKDKKGKETVGIKDLEKLRVKSKFLEGYIKLKKLEKKITSFGSNWLQYINAGTGRIHCSVNQILNTGRTATYSPNLYQIPREDKYRNCFKPQDKDYVFIGADYSAQEGRIMADKAKDTAYIEFFKTGDGDAHSFVASKMFSARYARDIVITAKSISVQIKNEDPKELAKSFIKESELKLSEASWTEENGYVVIDLSKKNEWRQKGKTLNFFLSFGGSAYTLSNDLKISMEEAQGLVNAFFTAFPSLKTMFNSEALFAVVNGYTITNTITRRRRYYPDWGEMNNLNIWISQQKSLLGQNFWNQVKDKASLISKENRKAYVMKGDIEREAQNQPIQGTAADMSKLAFVLYRERILDAGYKPIDGCPIKPILMPHDELVSEVLRIISKEWAIIKEECMEEAGRVFVKTLSLRPKAEITEFWKK